jgi:catechol 2,3-dioxygenase
MSQISGLAEVVLMVSDLEASLAFYRDVLGLTLISPPHTPAAFLRVGEDREGVPQQVVLVPRPQGVGPSAKAKAGRDLHHLALEVPRQAFEAEKQRLADASLVIRPGEHPFLPVEAFYIDDPDGNEVEIVSRVHS